MESGGHRLDSLEDSRRESLYPHKPIQKKTMTDTARMASMVSAMFATTEGDSPESIEQRARFYKLVPGIHWPDDWDSLDQAEQKKRLDGMDKLGLQGK